MNKTVSLEKFLIFTKKFAIHEEWIQRGCSAVKTPSNTVPGYYALANQNFEAYSFYRRSLLPYLSKARGNKIFFVEFKSLLDECKRKYTKDMIQFERFHQTPSEKFKGQWLNLFDRFIDTSLTHENCYLYLQKYEVEIFLLFLTQLRQINSEKGFEEKPFRFLDKSGKFKKGGMVNYISGGFQNYSEVKKMLNKAYNTKLRNIIGHHNYRIEGDRLVSLEKDFTITRNNFLESYICLQEIQNAILWSLSDSRKKNYELCKYGVTSVGFDIGNPGSQDFKMYIFQINSFRIIDPMAEWIKVIHFEIKGKKLITKLSDIDAHHGLMNEDLHSFFKMVDSKGQVNVSVVPIMPCFHEGCTAIETPWGDFCQCEDQFNILAQAIVQWK